MGLSEKIDEIEKETLGEKQNLKERIEFWKTHNLSESLYNDGKTPKPQDVAQVSNSKFDKYGLGDCYLLAKEQLLDYLQKSAILLILTQDLCIALLVI